ncbi:MAG: VWA domain-containing protein [Calditrichaeota bacterium]|nr:VWA domain-containing protein [Calditrichota bacterium]RQW02152.1 MAG: VWA domain-containing protein [Calditrichota bacterium]
MFRFANPEFLFLLLLIPPLVYYHLRRRKRLSGKIQYSTLRHMKRLPQTWRLRFRKNAYIFRMLVLVLIIIGLARPQSGTRKQEITTEGIDIMLALDVSTSMLAEDFKPKNRIVAAKEVASEFIQGRNNDRIGLVIFAGEAFTQCPLTLDYGVLTELLDKIQVAPEQWDGTAIGNGLATSVLRLKNSRAKSKVIILLTDGRNNAGEIDPLTAAQVAETFDIRIYTIGAGTRGSAMYPVDDPIFGRRYISMQVEIDEELLKNIANQTGGQYFRATDTEKLRQIYQEINEMEKTRIQVKEFTRYRELYINYAGAGLLLLIIEILLLNTWLRKLP